MTAYIFMFSLSLSLSFPMFSYFVPLLYTIRSLVLVSVTGLVTVDVIHPHPSPKQQLGYQCDYTKEKPRSMDYGC